MKQFFLCLILIIALPVSAATDFVSSHFTAHGAGLHLLDASLESDQTAKGYKSTTKTQTRGLLSVLLPSITTFYVDGKIKNNQYISDYFSMDTITNDSSKKREVNLADKPGFVDYQTAILAMMNVQKPQTQSFKVADGRRDLLITFTYMGQVDLEPNKYSCYAGSADYYNVSIEVTAGRKKGWFFNRMKDKSSPPLRLYFAQIGNGPKKAFVRGSFDTAIFGEINVYLSDFEQGKR